jgi:hypothetical protein
MRLASMETAVPGPLYFCDIWRSLFKTMEYSSRNDPIYTDVFDPLTWSIDIPAKGLVSASSYICHGVLNYHFQVLGRKFREATFGEGPYKLLPLESLKRMEHQTQQYRLEGNAPL